MKQFGKFTDKYGVQRVRLQSGKVILYDEFLRNYSKKIKEKGGFKLPK